MKKWETALHKFIEPLKNKKEVAGVLVCGSFITGNPTKHSDIDVHIILKQGTKWRERGNKIIDGFLIEYFANPSKQIIEYFKEDHKSHEQMAITQFLTGKIIFDNGEIKKLKAEAKKIYKKKFQKISNTQKELMKYGIWDAMDNLENSLEKRDNNYWFIYHNTLSTIIKEYCKFIGYPIIKEDKSLGILTDKKTRDKYLLKEFPDKTFKNLIIKAMTINNKQASLQIHKKITNHILKKMGGFNIDGWKIKSTTSY